ncbi:MAG: sterol desaturase family protein [Cyclobacteriaceae bacterium]
MNFDPVFLAIPIFLTLILVELGVDAYHQFRHYRLNDAVTNLSCGMLTQLFSVFLAVAAIGLYHVVSEKYALFSIPFTWYNLALLIILTDFAFYWAHRFNHRISLLWGAHEVHHQSEDFNLTVALRQSIFHDVAIYPFYLPLALAGFGTSMFIYAIAVNAIYQFFIHTEYVRSLGPLEYVLNTPAHHRVHHGRNPEYIDKNYGGLLIIWDRLFGTFEPEKRKAVYGITTPLNTFNPISAQLHQIRRLIRRSQHTPGLKNKIKLWFMPPGWTPEGELPIPEVAADSYQKFHFNLPKLASRFVLGQLILTSILTIPYSINEPSLPLESKVLVTLLVCWLLFNDGGLLDRRAWAFASEWTRLIATPLLLVFGLSLSSTFVLAILIYSACLIAWFAYVRYKTEAVSMGVNHEAMEAGEKSVT